jgi:acyl carrier protein
MTGGIRRHMNKKAFLNLIDELLELDEGTVAGDEELEERGWNSLAAVGFIAMADEQFGVIVAPAKLAHCRTANQLAELLGDKVV